MFFLYTGTKKLQHKPRHRITLPGFITQKFRGSVQAESESIIENRPPETQFTSTPEEPIERQNHMMSSNEVQSGQFCSAIEEPESLRFHTCPYHKRKRNHSPSYLLSMNSSVVKDGVISRNNRTRHRTVESEEECDRPYSPIRGNGALGGSYYDLNSCKLHCTNVSSEPFGTMTERNPVESIVTVEGDVNLEEGFL